MMFSYMNSKIGCLSGWKFARVTLVGFSPLITFICFFRIAVLCVEKLHWSHLLGITPLCTIIWILRLAAWAVASLRWSHLLISSTMYLQIWLFRFAQLPNAMPTCICYSSHSKPLLSSEGHTISTVFKPNMPDTGRLYSLPHRGRLCSLSTNGRLAVHNLVPIQNAQPCNY